MHDERVLVSSEVGPHHEHERRSYQQKMGPVQEGSLKEEPEKNKRPTFINGKERYDFWVTTVVHPIRDLGMTAHPTHTHALTRHRVERHTLGTAGS